jgi:hypothetical protein
MQKCDVDDRLTLLIPATDAHQALGGRPEPPSSAAGVLYQIVAGTPRGHRGFRSLGWLRPPSTDHLRVGKLLVGLDVEAGHADARTPSGGWAWQPERPSSLARHQRDPASAQPRDPDARLESTGTHPRPSAKVGSIREPPGSGDPPRQAATR